MEVVVPWTTAKHRPPILGVFSDINKAKRAVKEAGWQEKKVHYEVYKIIPDTFLQGD